LVFRSLCRILPTVIVIFSQRYYLPFGDVFMTQYSLRSHAFGTVFLLGCAVFVSLTACGTKEDPRWAEAEKRSKQEIEARKEAQESGALPKPQEGGALNTFIPKASGEFETVASQEKNGFAEYKLKKSGKDVAMLAISDVANNPQAAEKFKTSTRMIDGFPLVDQGSTASALLVGSRYQVKVLSRDPAFTKTDREAWLAKFNLAGLAALK
jgi:hypothetical protein